jgi:hypothetical protein
MYIQLVIAVFVVGRDILLHGIFVAYRQWLEAGRAVPVQQLTLS